MHIPSANPFHGAGLEDAVAVEFVENGHHHNEDDCDHRGVEAAGFVAAARGFVAAQMRVVGDRRTLKPPHGRNVRATG